MRLRRVFNLIIVLIFMICFTSSSFSSMDVPFFTQAEVDYSEKVLDGFLGFKTREYDKFINDVSEINISTNVGKTVAISKKLSNKYLLIGHSVVAIGYQNIVNEKIDIIGLAGGQFNHYLQLNKKFNKNYNTIYVWYGINDIIRYFSLLTMGNFISFEDFFSKIRDDIYQISRQTPESKVVFILISPTNSPSVDVYVDLLNNYIRENFNYIEINGIYPDLDSYHFTPESFKLIFDTYIKPNLIY